MGKKEALDKILDNIDREKKFVMLEAKYLEKLKAAAEQQDEKGAKRAGSRAARIERRIHRFLQRTNAYMGKIREHEPSLAARIADAEQQLNIYEKKVMREVAAPMIGEEGQIRKIIENKPIDWVGLKQAAVETYEEGVRQLLVILENLEKMFKQMYESEKRSTLKEADEEIVYIMDMYKIHDVVGFINPINAKEEKQKFFDSLERGRKYNPGFVYKKLPFAPDDVMNQTKDVMQKLRGIKIDYSKGLGKIFEKKRQDLITKLKLLRSIGTSKVTKYSVRLYGKPSSHLVKRALKICLHYRAEVEEKKPYDARYVRDVMETELKKKGYDEWTVEIDPDMSSNANVSAAKKKVQIREDASFSQADIRRLIVHELGVHATRAMQGEGSGYKTLRYGTSGYLPTEEGLATYKEKAEGVIRLSVTHEYAARVLAVKFALHHSFYDVFRKLKFYRFSDEVAYKTTQRAKRGLSDTSKKGGFIKDHVYILGGKLIDEYLEAGYDIKELEKGKIGVRDVPVFIQQAKHMRN